MKKPTSLHISLSLLVAVQLMLLLTSCSPTKKLAEGELLLDQNIIAAKSPLLDKNEMQAYIKQKPNREILFYRFHLRVYNSVNQDKMVKKKMRINARKESKNSQRIEKNNKKNIKREAKGKKPKKVHLKKINKRTRREVILSIGEPPVIYDSLLAGKSARQLTQYLNNKGFFYSKVRDSLSAKNQRADVHYIVQLERPYNINNVTYDIKDAQLSYYITSDAPSTLIKKGMRYDVDVIQRERDRITNMLRNDGYFNFSKEFIYFEIDSSLGTHEVNIKIGAKNPLVKVEGHKDSTAEIAHTRFYIKDIFIHTDFDPKLKTAPRDTLLANDYHILSTEGLRYKPRLITEAIFISKGELYQQKHADQTYRRLSDLRLFRSIQIQYVPVGNSQVECFIYLSNIPKQSFAIETEGINTYGTLGVAGNIVYKNKNIFAGGEIFEIKLKGALEVQKTKSDDVILTESPFPFNTLELGTEVNLFIPRFVTPFKIKSIKNNNAKTNLIATYHFQRRPDYGRSIANTTFGYSWNETSTKRHIINPIEFNLVNVFQMSAELQETINNSTDLYLKNSYSPHLTLGPRYAFIFSNQDLRKQKNFSYFRFGIEEAGILSRLLFGAIDNNVTPLDYDENPDGISYTVENIPFSHYMRSDVDYRFYKMLREKSKLVYRIAAGAGVAFSNFKALPLEKSFFAGGPNSMRAWLSRTLGPGGYSDPNNVIDKIGDIKIEGNLEYRFNVYKFLNSALFMDIGNIWLNKYQSSFPKGNFSFATKGDTVETFVNQFAIGVGLGLRFDFNFFIIRLDGAMKIRDPALKPDDRWMFDKPLNTVLNFGIGYPF